MLLLYVVGGMVLKQKVSVKEMDEVMESSFFSESDPMHEVNQKDYTV
jgi:hypothetical protein